MALDFPSNPVDNQVYDNFIYNSAKGTWKSLSSGASPSILKDVTISPTSDWKIPLTIQGYSNGHQEYIQKWQKSDGTFLAGIDNYGIFSLKSGTKFYNDSTELVNTIMTPKTSATPVISSYGLPGQTADMQRWYDSSGNILASVDSSGRFKQPNQPSFRATAGSLNGSGLFYNYSASNSGMAFRYRNTGNHMNMSTGRFTAPIAGRYYIYALYNSTNATVERNIGWLYINGVSIGEWGEAYGQFTDMYTAGVFSLNASDYVEFYTHPGIPFDGVTAGIDFWG